MKNCQQPNKLYRKNKFALIFVWFIYPIINRTISLRSVKLFFRPQFIATTPTKRRRQHVGQFAWHQQQWHFAKRTAGTVATDQCTTAHMHRQFGSDDGRWRRRWHPGRYVHQWRSILIRWQCITIIINNNAVDNYIKILSGRRHALPIHYYFIYDLQLFTIKIILFLFSLFCP